MSISIFKRRDIDHRVRRVTEIKFPSFEMLKPIIANTKRYMIMPTIVYRVFTRQRILIYEQ